ncbi:tyrosine-type recombinase/integrase [Yersinia alsatica]|uniref:Tyrosine-type recombinase/integrase n=1 Tax=Yersinia alsatica TaxID=2890317 RepID=A0ABY5UML3_9GAMM|nr:tyrosine-type recombinase/integrase [Yersinia alsatica]OWF68907.1 integrase [Yersinia frederiksenii]UWM44711.1 tyrosine-type recombinase/integrase [Yersinia alsatica]CNK95802.1 integrase [Yersinia frederiksenii]CNL71698.1 integrase [Yersinia frederiksenii]
MAARRRSAALRDLPPNLYVRNGGYYSYKDPRTGKEFGLGRDKRFAINQAVEANMQFMDSGTTARLVDRINGVAIVTVSEWVKTYTDVLSKRGLKSKTITDYHSRLEVVGEVFSSRSMDSISTKDIATLLNDYTNNGKAASAKLMRSFLTDFFREAVSEGVIYNNPVDATKNPKVEVKRARLSLDNFLAIRVAAAGMPAWVVDSMDLAIVTGQRVGDVRKMKWADIKDDKLFVEQEKTGMRLVIPLDLRIDTLSLSLRDIISRCEKRPVKGVTIISSEKGEPFADKTLTKRFARARDLASITWEGTNPPPFHEIRSLASRLYEKEKGKEFAQKILGHKSSQTTDKYRDVRGSEWIEIVA